MSSGLEMKKELCRIWDRKTRNFRENCRIFDWNFSFFRFFLWFFWFFWPVFVFSVWPSIPMEFTRFGSAHSSSSLSDRLSCRTFTTFTLKAVSIRLVMSFLFSGHKFGTKSIVAVKIKSTLLNSVRWLRMICCCVNLMFGWLTDWFRNYPLMSFAFDWLIDWSSSIDWLIDWLIVFDWLIDWLIDLLTLVSNAGWILYYPDLLVDARPAPPLLLPLQYPR